MHLIKWSRLDLNQSESELALKGKKKAKNSSLLLEAQTQNSNYSSKKILVLEVSCIERPYLNGRWQWQCNIHLGWVKPHEGKKFTLTFLPWKMEISFFLPHKKRPQEGNGMTQKFYQQHSPDGSGSATSSALLQGRGRDEQQECEVRGWERGDVHYRTHSTHSSLQAQRWPASSRNSFPRDSSCGSRSCSLKKDTSLFSLFLVFPVLTF